MADQFIYPPRNLPGLAEDWGRASETHANLLSKELVQQSQTMNNALRATGGQLAVIAQQVDLLGTTVDLLGTTVADLSARKSHSSSTPNFSFMTAAGGTTYTNWAGTTRVISFPPTDISRSALIAVSANATSPSSIGAPAFVMGADYNSSPVWRSESVYLGSGGSPKPTGWVPSTFSVFSVDVPGGVSPSITLQFQGSIFGGTPVQVDVSNITATIIYGGPA